MGDAWTAHTVAEALMRVFPSMGRFMSLYMRDVGEEETTIMQIGVLFQIQKEPMTASELAKKRRVSLQAASVLVQGLVQRGWVSRTPDPHDRRQYLIQITPEGSEHAETTRKQIANYLARFLEGLSAEALEAGGVFLPALYTLLTTQMEADTQATTLENEKQALIQTHKEQPAL